MNTRIVMALPITLSLLIFFACTKSKETRAPSSVNSINEIIEVPSNLELASKQLLDFLSGDEFNSRNCAPILNSIYEDVFQKDADFFDRTALGAGAYPILNNLWLDSTDWVAIMDR